MAANDEPDLPWYKLFMVYFSYLVIIGFSYLVEYFEKYVLWRNLFQTPQVRHEITKIR